MKQKTLPTDFELEILKVLWSKKQASVREVYDIICEKKQSVYTSTLKTMQKMLDKGLIGREVQNNTHMYFPMVQESVVRNKNVNELLEKFFDGSYLKLALHALGNASQNESAEELTSMIEKITTKKGLK